MFSSSSKFQVHDFRSTHYILLLSLCVVPLQQVVTASSADKSFPAASSVGPVRLGGEIIGVRTSPSLALAIQKADDDDLVLTY